MTISHVHELAASHIVAARTDPAGRSSGVIAGSAGQFFQMMVGLRAGGSLLDHENPGHTTILVVTGDVELTCEQGSLWLSSGQFVVVPECTHSIIAASDAAVVLSVVPRTAQTGPVSTGVPE